MKDTDKEVASTVMLYWTRISEKYQHAIMITCVRTWLQTCSMALFAGVDAFGGW